jgi:hypothetical protein
VCPLAVGLLDPPLGIVLEYEKKVFKFSITIEPEKFQVYPKNSPCRFNRPSTYFMAQTQLQ